MRRKTLQHCALLIGAFALAGVASTAFAQHAGPFEPEDAIGPDLLDEFAPYDFSIPPPSPSAPAGKIDPSKFVPAPAGWDAKGGLDPRASAFAVRPDQLLPGVAPDRSSGVAWANVAAPVVETPWDKASLQARVDPQQQGTFGMALSRSVPVGQALSLTWLNSYSLTQTLSHGIAPAGPDDVVIPGPQSPGAAQVYGTSQSMRFTFVPSDTSISLGAALSTTDDKWLRSLTAEQKLFGGPLSVSAGLTESAPGEYSKSLKAGFKRTW
jgi:hypothetical protein